MINIGQKIGERYEVIRSIGSGGMANVYLARDLILNRDVAIKVLRFDFQNDQDAIRRFQREALAATEMVHPNIVGVYDVGEDYGMQYIVMEYVEGTDLKRYIKDNSPIPLPTVVNIMEQILAAISVAHQHQIIHRDLKPQNILIARDGTVKITDFGIAIALSETSITQTNTLLGSVHYLSPEQARGGMATRQSDIYALGIILYELLTGVVPFEGESAVSIALKHFQNDMPSVRRFNPSIPQSLENVVLHATAKEAADRYQTVDEMYNDIKTVLNPARANESVFTPSVMTDDTIMLTPVREPEKVEQREIKPNQVQQDEHEDERETPKKKKPMKLILIGLALVLLIGGGLYALGRGGGEVIIPDVKGKSQTEAEAILKTAKLKVKPKIERISDDSVEKDRVVKTDPGVGTPVKENTTVTLFVSSGDKSVAMTNLSNLDIDAAENQLLNEGFLKENITIKEETSDTIEEGRIIKQVPKAGEKVVPREAKVTLVKSSGRKVFKLENMYGYSSNRVNSYIDSMGLTLIEGQSEYSSSVPSGQVIYTIPSSGTEMKKGDQVTVVYSAGRDPSTVQPVTTVPESSKSETEQSSEPKESTQSSSHGENNSKPDTSKDEGQGNKDERNS
ncbi:Stk1 family PASTA domain-containing Ser/Thr kinase [Vagococcus vulneris]|uniref:non-specific serine/threonine protein kinase n=1 Tax=Vagococcus vulneris TaxID=1977869 RepID=A0A429ZXR2_9ENTE|nr:Stk1 family PASTA domain-containing Ser/Thr kinase [Vagococcus vulneris]RST98566.1 hypothetical protein CBF37_07265 [Vagococcus vulneris]